MYGGGAEGPLSFPATSSLRGHDNMMITTHKAAGMSLATVLTALCTSIVLADIVEYRDKEEWEAAAGSWSTADFTGFPMGTPIDEQYAYLGVHFVDGYDFVVLGSSYPND